MAMTTRPDRAPIQQSCKATSGVRGPNMLTIAMTPWAGAATLAGTPHFRRRQLPLGTQPLSRARKAVMYMGSAAKLTNLVIAWAENFEPKPITAGTIATTRSA